MNSPKLTATQKRAIKDYVKPHTDLQASTRFGVPVAVIRAVVKAGPVVKKSSINKRYLYGYQKEKTGL